MKKKFNYKKIAFVLDTETLEITSPNSKVSTNFNSQLKRYYTNYCNVDGKQCYVPRARLICQAYHPLSDDDLNKFVCDHIDSNSMNDDPSNLRWVTKKQNNTTQHATKMRKQNATNRRHPNEIIMAVNKTTGEIAYFSNGHACADALGCSHVLVYNVLNAKHFAKSACGWILSWEPCSPEFKKNLFIFENLEK